MAGKDRPTKDNILRLEYVPLAQLQVAARNPKRHRIEELGSSIGRFGYVEPIIIDERTGRMVAGHGRRETLLKLKADGQDPPAGVRSVKGEWSVPVVRGWASKSDKDAEAYLIASNRHVELGGWDDNELLALLNDVDLDGTGFSHDDVTDLLDRVSAQASHPGDPDDVPAAPAVPVSRTGDLWLLGEHRLLCGDSTKPENVATALAGCKPHLMVTDPPYGVEYNVTWRHEAGVINSSRRGKVENDDRIDWRSAWALFPGDVAYVWHAGIHASAVQASIEACGFGIRCQIVWNKSSMVFGRGDYHWKHEPCWYAVRQGKAGHWNGDRKQTTVWDISNKADDGENAAQVHGTQKPVECMRRPILNNSKAGDRVYEPFSGSGTTIIAAETTARICHAIELLPAYVDVGVTRWEQFTGGKATLDGDGRTFEEVKAERVK